MFQNRRNLIGDDGESPSSFLLQGPYRLNDDDTHSFENSLVAAIRFASTNSSDAQNSKSVRSRCRPWNSIAPNYERTPKTATSDLWKAVNHVCLRSSSPDRHRTNRGEHPSS